MLRSFDSNYALSKVPAKFRLAKIIDAGAFGLIAILLIFLPWHAFLFTFFKSFFWTAEWTIWVQAWKEILVTLLAILAGSKILIFWRLPQRKSFYLALGLILFAFSHTLLVGGEFGQKFWALGEFILPLSVFLSIQFFKMDFAVLTKLLFGSLALVLLFGFCQKLFLPVDFLTNFGYSANFSSWIPGGNLPAYHIVSGTEIARVQSTFSSPNKLASFLILVLPLAYFFYLQKQVKFLTGFILIVGVLVLFWTYARLGWLALFLIVVTLLWRNWHSQLAHKLKIGLFCLGGFFLIGALLQTNLQEILLREASTTEHFTKMQMGLEAFWQNPWGSGLGSTDGLTKHFGHGLNPENTFLAVAVELGLLGGLLFLCFWLQLIVELARQKSPFFYALLGLTLMLFFSPPLEDAPNAFTLFLLTGLSLESGQSSVFSNQ